MPQAPLSDAAFRDLLSECEEHRLLGFLASAVRCGALPVGPSQRDDLEQRYTGWLAHDLRLEQLLLRALAALADASVRARAFKGVALAHTAYQDAAERVFGDLDVLVPSNQFGRAVDVLTKELGAARNVPELRGGFDEHFGKEAMVRTAKGLEVDLHRTLVEGAYGLTVQLEDLFGPPYRFPLGQYELETLAMPARFLQTCYSAVLGDWPSRLATLRDVAQLALRERPHLIDVLMMAKRWRCEVVIARAMTVTWRELAIVERTPLVEWAERYRPTRMDRFLLASHTGPARAFTRHAAAVTVISGMPARLEYLRAITFPQTSYLAARGLTRTQHASRAVRRFLDRP